MKRHYQCYKPVREILKQNKIDTTNKATNKTISVLLNGTSTLPEALQLQLQPFIEKERQRQPQKTYVRDGSTQDPRYRRLYRALDAQKIENAPNLARFLLATFSNEEPVLRANLAQSYRLCADGGFTALMEGLRTMSWVNFGLVSSHGPTKWKAKPGHKLTKYLYVKERKKPSQAAKEPEPTQVEPVSLPSDKQKITELEAKVARLQDNLDSFIRGDLEEGWELTPEQTAALNERRKGRRVTRLKLIHGRIGTALEPKEIKQEVVLSESTLVTPTPEPTTKEEPIHLTPAELKKLKQEHGLEPKVETVAPAPMPKEIKIFQVPPVQKLTQPFDNKKILTDIFNIFVDMLGTEVPVFVNDDQYHAKEMDYGHIEFTSKEMIKENHGFWAPVREVEHLPLTVNQNIMMPNCFCFRLRGPNFPYLYVDFRNNRCAAYTNLVEFACAGDNSFKLQNYLVNRLSKAVDRLQIEQPAQALVVNN